MARPPQRSGPARGRAGHAWSRGAGLRTGDRGDADHAGPVVRVKPGRDKSLRLHHPWLFSGAIDAVIGDPGVGETVVVLDAEGSFLARAAYSPASQIRARAWTFDPQEAIDAAFFRRRVERAVHARQSMLDARHTACRLMHGESDGLPGVVADRYGEVVVLQLSAAGAEHWRDAIVQAVADATGVSCVYERSDAEVRTLEGLPARTGPIVGALPSEVMMVEDGVQYRVDVAAGQKTGFFLDQRDNRAAVRAHAAGRTALNMFCYTGGFTLAALAGGAAHVLSVDSSADALELARENLARNPQLPAARAEWRQADAFTELRRLRDMGASFDLIVLDPPKFAPTAQHAERAARAYKDINLWALKLLRPNGLLATFSCSGGIDAALFRKIVAGAAVDAKAEALVEGQFTASADHAVALAFPEGEYLKGLLLRRIE
jgi:23S rRNA (cytosine1962-C5)-methyltransferase